MYLHWNGGRDSIEGFLEYCKLRGFRPPEEDNYGWARLCQVIANFFGEDGLGIGIDEYERLDTDNYDNGTYVIEDWKIVDRLYYGDYPEQAEYGLEQMMCDIDNHQPKLHQVGKDRIREFIEKEKGG